MTVVTSSSSCWVIKWKTDLLLNSEGRWLELDSLQAAKGRGGRRRLQCTVSLASQQEPLQPHESGRPPYCTQTRVTASLGSDGTVVVINELHLVDLLSLDLA
jgi:hypothetical protein